MRACTFVSEAVILGRKYQPGEEAVLQEAFVRALERRGLVATPAPVAVPPEAPPLPAGPVEERVTKPAPSLSRRALKKLFKRKVTP